MKQIYNILGGLILSMSLVTTTYALPTISSENNQTFNKNQISTQLRNITITDDSVTPLIKKGLLKITIPESIAFIYDDERTLQYLSIYGSAVETGKVMAKPQITFEKKDKTLVIPVEKDFTAGEFIVIAQAYAEGFHSQPSNSTNFQLQINSNSTQYSDDKYIYIQSGTKSDTYKPEVPTNIVVKDDTNGVKLTWTDPTDLDLKTIQILRGLNGATIDASTAILVPAGSQEYLDTKVVKGDTVKYILNATDGLNNSDNSIEISFVVGSTPVLPPPVVPPVIVPTPEPTPPAPLTCQSSFPDIDSKSANCAAIEYLKEKGVLNGYPDGTFRPDNTINRAEFLKVVLLLFKKNLVNTASLNFSDTEKDAWYLPYLNTATSLGVISGYPDGTFKPAQTVNKVEAMKIILKTSGKTLPANPSISPFSDTSLDSWYINYVQFFKDKLLDLGDGQGSLWPDKKMTRVEIAEYLYKFSQI